MVKVIFLGTGNAFNQGGRSSSCYLVQGSKNILLDAGPQVLPGIYGYGLKPSDIDVIALSHLHADHMGGLPFMMLDDKWITKREKPIDVLVPKGGPDLIERICSVYYSQEEVDHIASVFRYTIFEVGNTVEINGVTFEALPALHSAEPKMIFMTIDGKSIGYSGDSAYLEESILKLLEADITIHECTSFNISIPNHVNYEELSEKISNLANLGRVSASKKIYLSHVDESMEENKDKIKAPFVLVRDRDEVEI